jgi:hypothetical protein
MKTHGLCHKPMVVAVTIALFVPTCTIDIPNPLVTGTAFIVKGTYEVRPVFGRGDCPVWVAETGVLYHLFQGDAVSNADFDAVTTPGVASRLRIATRDDLTVACELGTTVVVQAVLQIIQ